jgi:ATP-binding cassette subfamily C protein CydD
LAGIEGGVNARIGDGGGGISGGERRRIALARALVRNAPVLLLDEPTSDLDPATERRFLDTLRTVGRDRILLIVAHGTACADVGDVVYELRDGGLVLVRGSVAVA